MLILCILNNFPFVLPSNCQEWKLFSAADAVNDLEIHDDHLWTIAGSGLSKINIHTGEITNWNTVNSELPDYQFNHIAIDSSGLIWLAGRYNFRLVRFDGNDFETITAINGHNIYSISNLEVAPDGIVWLNTVTETEETYDERLFYFENNQFTEVAPPSPDWFISRPLAVDSASHLWAIFHKVQHTDYIIGEYDGTQWIEHSLVPLGARIGHNDELIGDHQGNIYVLIGNSTVPNFLKYDGVQWQPISLPAAINDFINHERPIYIDALDRVWISLENGTFIRYDGQEWSTIEMSSLGIDSGFPDGVRMDKNEHLWFIHKNAYFGSDRTLQYFNNTTSTKIDLSNSALPTNGISQIIIDPQNNKWLLSGNGLIKFNGTDWINIGQAKEYYYIAGPNYNGGIWLNPFNSFISQFDGLTVSTIDITDPEGNPYTYVQNAVVDKKGIVYVAGGGKEIVVFDHGVITYLDSIDLIFFGSPYPQDWVYEVQLDKDDRLYNLGFSLNRLEDDSSWTEIPLWEQNPTIHTFTFAPNNDIWFVHGIPLPDRGLDFEVYDGIEWKSFEHPFINHSIPKWDAQGIMWMSGNQGLCKYVNDDWFCYDEHNSPLTGDGIENFVFDSFQNIWITLNDGGVMLFNEDQIHDIEGTDLPLIGGTIYRDINQNTIPDSEDTPLALHRALLLPDSVVAFSNYDGRFTFSVPPGDYEVKYIPRENWHIDNSPESYLVNVTTDPVSGLDFSIAPVLEISDMRVFINEGFPRCNRPARYWLSFGNFGTDVESGEIKFVLDSLSALEWSYPAPSIISGDTITWYFNHQLPFSTSTIDMDLFIPGPVENDSTVLFKAFLYTLDNNTTVLRDSAITEQWLFCAFDPNDKIAKTKHPRSDGTSDPSDPIQYTIRFQNTGNDTAFNVVIRDTLDKNLDLNTLEIVGGSHPFETSLQSDGALEFRFINILLPDSLANEQESHGFVSYTIQAKKDLPSPTIIINTAHIYFDFNTGIRTNSTLNHLTTLVLNTDDFEKVKLKKCIRAYPNPVADEIILALEDDVEEHLINFYMLDVFGRKVLEGVIEKGNRKIVAMDGMAEGIYFIYTAGAGNYDVIAVVKGKK